MNIMENYSDVDSDIDVDIDFPILSGPIRKLEILCV